MLQKGSTGPEVETLQICLLRLGCKIKPDGVFGPRTEEIVRQFQERNKLEVDGIVGPETMHMIETKMALQNGQPAPKRNDTPKVETPARGPVYPKEHKYHPRFESKLPKEYTHLHPIDVLRSVAGEKEVLGSKDNPLIAHFHEHSKNLGIHSEGADYHDEVPHCSSAMNWAADMSGCKKTDHALARSWIKYGYPRVGDWVEEGDLVNIGTSHITMANKRFNKKTSKHFEGFGSNQGNSIKTSIYPVAKISAVNVWRPLPETRLAPIGILGHKPVPAVYVKDESTT